MTDEAVGHAVQCKRCSYKWWTLLARPKACPECKSRKWDQDRIPLRDTRTGRMI